jgi:hypothetical protein
MHTQIRIRTPFHACKRFRLLLLIAGLSLALLLEVLVAASALLSAVGDVSLTASSRQIQASWELGPATEGVRLVNAGWPDWSREPAGWVEQWLPAAPVAGRQEVVVFGEGPSCLWAEELAWQDVSGTQQRVVLRRVWLGCGWS